MALHIGGLSSGTDYAGMIEQLMEARRVPIDLKDDQRTEVDYDLGAWTEVNSLAESLTDNLDKLRGFDLWRSMSAESSLEGVVTATAADASAEQEYAISVSSIAREQSISSNALDTSSDLITNGYAQEGNIFEIEGQQITIAAGETLASLRTKINTAALDMDEGTRVQASIVNDHLVLTREDSGSGSIALSDVSGTALQNFGVLDGVGAIVNENISGSDANFIVNGIAVTRSTNTGLDDVVEGLTINLKGVGTATLDVHPDREQVKEVILELVEKYNELAELIDDYTQNDLSSSSELSITGELYGDALINSLRSGIRATATMQSSTLNALNASYSYEGQTGVMDSLADIGIWTSGQDNRLEIVDEDQLEDMLENEFDNISQLFRGVYDEATVSMQGGIGSEFYKYISKISESLTGDVAQRIDTLTSKYDDYSDEIEEMEDALADYEQDLWNQFTAMEDSLANMNSQLEYLKSMFGGK